MLWATAEAGLQAFSVWHQVSKSLTVAFGICDAESMLNLHIYKGHVYTYSGVNWVINAIV